MKHGGLLACLFLVLVFPLSAQNEISDPSFLVFDLDSNGILSLGAAFRIAENGIVVGLGLPFAADYSQATLWDDEGTHFLPTLPEDESSTAFDVGEDGTVVGESDDVVEVGHQLHIYPHAALWIDGQAVALSSLVTGGADLELFEANRINEKGQILGWGRDATIPAGRAFLFEDGFVTDLGSLKQGGNSDPFDMNEQGHVVGCATAPDNFDHAFLWMDGTMTDLHDPDVIEGRTSTARAINEFGVIAGSADFIGDFIDFETATVWDHGVITNLGVLGGGQSYARDLNDHGTIVGTTTVVGPGVHAFIYRDDKMEDLNDLIPPNSGWILANAHAISNDGRIAGEGFNNGLRPFILVPDCEGKFEIYGAGCSGSNGFTPGLYGQGCPTSKGDVSFVVVNGVGGAAGLLLFGTGTGVGSFKPGCDIQILPLLPTMVPILLEGAGSGAGVWHVSSQLPDGLPTGLITLQTLLVDGGGPGGFTVTHPLKMDIH